MQLGNRVERVTISYGKRKLDVHAVNIEELEVVNIKANIFFDGLNYRDRDSLFYIADTVRVKVVGGFIYDVDSVDLNPSSNPLVTGEAALDNFEEHYFENMEDEIFIDIQFVVGSTLRLVVPRAGGALVDFSTGNGGHLTIASCSKCRNVQYCACTSVG